MIAKETILQRVQALPALSTAVAELASLRDDPLATALAYERVIRPDPALSTNFLRLANSAHFGTRHEIKTVRAALALLGTKRLYEVVVGAALHGVLPERLPGYEVDLPGFWRHCAAVAALSERLSTELRVGAPDFVFTAGLLHDIGKLVIGSFLAAESAEVLARVRGSEKTFIDAEHEVLGWDHSEIGAEVARAWRLPEAVVDTARWHHSPSECPTANRTLVDMVHVADGLAHSLGMGADTGELARRIEVPAMQRLHVTARTLERIACDSLANIKDLCHSLEGNAGRTS
ncbi:MAG: HDOD domain-containing protein [bacterium]